MFLPTLSDVSRVLRDYGISAQIAGMSELQRYHYEKDDPQSREVRLITRVDFADGAPLVIRFKNESDVTLEIIESQSRFAEHLRQQGIATPRQYSSNGAFAHWYDIGGYRVIVTVEEFVSGELQLVDPPTAEMTGELLARMHCIAEADDLHVDNAVLFDPFARNDLFDAETFLSIEPCLCSDDRPLFDEIAALYREYMDRMLPLREEPRYAVQGDISDCNLYRTPAGLLGVFDYNRSGDANLFCDAVMQGIFEARLMDYPPDAGEDYEHEILSAFLRGYCTVRPFTAEQRALYPYLTAVIRAFWSSDIRWSDDGLLHVAEAGNAERVHAWLTIIRDRLKTPEFLPDFIK